MEVLFFISNKNFPVKSDSGIWNPVEVVGGWVFSNRDETKALLDDMGIEYVVTDNEKILRYNFIYDEETGEVLKKEIPNLDKSLYYNLADGESFYEKTLRNINPLNWFK